MLTKAFLEITNVCNLSCTFCHKTVREKRFMTDAEFDSLTDKLRGRVRYLYFHLMGEPTLHPSLNIFIKSAKDKGFLPIITTNGSRLATVGDSLIEAMPHKISISLHDKAANPAFADSSYLESCADFARRAANAGCITVLRLWNLGGDGESENEACLWYLRSVFTNEWTTVRGGNGMRIADKLFLEWGEHFDWPDEGAQSIGADDELFCYGLRDQVGILVDGTVVPCCLDADGVLSLGNLFESELDAILKSERARAIYDGFSRRRGVESLCRKCGYARRFTKK